VVSRRKSRLNSSPARSGSSRVPTSATSLFIRFPLPSFGVVQR
jgi:hypothetical protein